MNDRILLVKDSNIDGKGLFTIQPIAADETVCRSDTDLLHQTKIAEIATWFPEKRNDFLKYAFQGGNSFYYGDIGAFTSDSSFFMNHSCNPNCAHKTDAEVIALRPIVADEELTIDYATIMSPNGLETPFLCNCGSENCRGEITKFDCLKPDLQKKYEPYFLSFISDLIKTGHI